MQFRCSMALFLVLIGIAKLPQHLRPSVVLLVFAYCMGSERWDVALYMSGIFLAERYLENLSTGRSLPQVHHRKTASNQKLSKIRKHILTLMWLGVFVLAHIWVPFPGRTLASAVQGSSGCSQYLPITTSGTPTVDCFLSGLLAVFLGCSACSQED